MEYILLAEYWVTGFVWSNRKFRWKGSTDNTKIGYEIEIFYRKKWRHLRMKGTHKHTEASPILFDNQKCLSQSHEGKSMWPHGNVVFILCSHTFTLFLIEIDICDCRNVSVKLPCVYVCLSSRNLFIFSARVSSLFS